MKIVRKSAIVVVLVVFFLCISYINYCLYSRTDYLIRRVNKNWKMIENLYEVYSVRDVAIKLDTTALHVLCIGNSITHHAPSKGNFLGADSMWRGNWGMCASRQDSDYVHRLEKKFKRYNKNTVFTRLNVWEWESDYTINKDSLFGSLCKNQDLIILRVGENASDDDHFRDAFYDLVLYCKQFTDNVIITGLYWKNIEKEAAIIDVSRKFNIPYVPLFWIFDLYKDKVMFSVGDTLYDTRGKPYPLATDFICTHPNDEGMRMIADAIYNVVIFE